MHFCKFFTVKTSIRYIGLHVCLVLAVSWQSCSQTGAGEAGYFRYNETSGISSLDPAFAKNQSNIWAVHQLFNTLVETDAAMQLQPSLARSWTISEDGRRIRFLLRDDVFFHDHAVFPGGKGRKMIAADVAYSFARLINPATASPGAWIFNNRVQTDSPFIAVNDSVFELRLQRPFVQILGVLSNAYCSVVPREVVEQYGAAFRSNPCGTGPFRFFRWEEGQVLLLRRNEVYFETDIAGQRLPYLQGVKVSFLDSKAAEFLEFRQGRLEFINDIDPSFKDEILTRGGTLRKAWEGKLVLHKNPYLNIEYLGILADTSNPLLQHSPLRFLQVRQAINYGFDRRKMMLYLRNSIGTAAESGFIPLGLPGFDSVAVKGFAYDPERARRLLQELGYSRQQPVPEIPLLTIPIYADLAAYIARELEEVGIRLKVEVIPKSLLLTQTARNQALFFRGSWIADYPDAENYLSVFYSANPSPPNYTRYRNKAYDALYEQSTREVNDSLRYQLYQRMDQIVINDAVVVPLWYDMVIHLVQPYVQQFRPNALNVLELRRVQLR